MARFTVEKKDVFIPSPSKGAHVSGTTYYTKRKGYDLMSIHSIETRSDTVDISYIRHSNDNGKSWSEPVVFECEFEDDHGIGRRHPRGGFVDPLTDRFLTIWTEGVLPSDYPLEGMKQWKLHYSVSEDGGKTTTVNEQIIHEGDEYDAIHHLPNVTVGKNCVMMGDFGQRSLVRSDGVILVPVQSSMVGPNGEYYNPGAGYTYTDCMILFGRWQADGHISWSSSERVCGDPKRTIRGLIEPTIAELADGRLLMVMRGSNDPKGVLPGYRWYSISSDGGQTWSDASPWKYTNDELFFSPSSCSQLIPHSSGHLFWMGNICEHNPRGNGPRYPICLGEVDLKSGFLVKESVTAIDDKQEHESPHLTLSNFLVREDRENGNLLLHLARLFANDFRTDGKAEWTADALIYTITT